MPIVKIFPTVSPLEEVARHRAKLSHGVARDQETQFIANPNPPNTIFDIGEHISRNKLPQKGLQHGHMASIPPQNFQKPSNGNLWTIQNSPTYVSSHLDAVPLPPPAIATPLDFDNPEILDGKLEIEKIMDDLLAQGYEG